MIMLIRNSGRASDLNPWEVGYYIPQHDTGTGEDWHWETVASFPALLRAAGFLHFLNGGGLIDLGGMKENIERASE